ncbi:hypothetical protein SDJN02_13572, partial [Cucurbita argyrosperma subsp. argyrosperma]
MKDLESSHRKAFLLADLALAYEQSVGEAHPHHPCANFPSLVSSGVHLPARRKLTHDLASGLHVRPLNAGTIWWSVTRVISPS